MLNFSVCENPALVYPFIFDVHHVLWHLSSAPSTRNNGKFTCYHVALLFRKKKKTVAFFEEGCYSVGAVSCDKAREARRGLGFGVNRRGHASVSIALARFLNSRVLLKEVSNGR
jgi:hypothetical protein